MPIDDESTSMIYKPARALLSNDFATMSEIEDKSAALDESYSPMRTDDEVNYCPTVWQQAVCTP